MRAVQIRQHCFKDQTMQHCTCTRELQCKEWSNRGRGSDLGSKVELRGWLLAE